MHYYYSDAWKKLALERLPRELKGESCEDLVWLGEEINMRIARMVERAERRQHRRPRGDRP
ncbi:hypothetical protein VIMS_00160 [Mycobacterium marinum]|nr:hypothetical protein VIMS_00160 [Mycobacterium marinum]